jgi:hypothetical protein
MQILRVRKAKNSILLLFIQECHLWNQSNCLVLVVVMRKKQVLLNAQINIDHLSCSLWLSRCSWRWGPRAIVLFLLKLRQQQRLVFVKLEIKALHVGHIYKSLKRNTPSLKSCYEITWSDEKCRKSRWTILDDKMTEWLLLLNFKSENMIVRLYFYLTEFDLKWRHLKPVVGVFVWLLVNFISNVIGCSHFYELLNAWEKRSQEIDAQSIEYTRLFYYNSFLSVRLLSLDLRLIRIGSNTSEFLAKA